MAARSVLPSHQWLSVCVLTHLSPVDAAKLHHLETWELDFDRPATTIYLSHLHKFQTHAATSAYKIAGGVDIASSRTVAKQIPIGRDFAVKIQKAFIDSLYSLLDGLELLSRSDYVPPSSAVEKAAASLTPLDISNHVRPSRSPSLTTTVFILHSVGYPNAPHDVQFRVHEQVPHSWYDQST